MEAAPADDDAIVEGTTIGEYVVEAELGRGGFGSVYRATQPLIGKRVAIKVLHPSFSSDREMASRFVSEARAVNQIGHRNIIDIFSFGTLPDGRQYYVMELLSGQTFTEYLRERGPLTIEQALPILRQVGKALDAAHARGVAHRDLKPDNVFITIDDGAPFPKLLDFGIAKLMRDETVQHKTQSGAPMGTPHYMSPEQCFGSSDVDHRTDIYSFGILVYQALTGRLPFDGISFIEICSNQMHGEPPAPSSIVPTMPAHVEAAILAMMAKRPGHRPESLARAIAALAGDEPLEPTPLELGATLPPPRRGAISEAPTVRATPPVVPAATTTSPGPVEPVAVPAPKGRRALWIAVAAGALATAGVAAYAMTRPSEPATPAPPIAAPAATPGDAAPVVVATPDAVVMPATATLTFVIEPADAVVVDRAGKAVSTAHGKISVTRSRDVLELTASRDGYQRQSLRVTPDRDQDVRATLVKATRQVEPPPPKTPPPTKDTGSGQGSSNLPKFDDKI